MVVAWITNHLRNGFFIFRPGRRLRIRHDAHRGCRWAIGDRPRPVVRRPRARLVRPTGMARPGHRAHRWPGRRGRPARHLLAPGQDDDVRGYGRASGRLSRRWVSTGSAPRDNLFGEAVDGGAVAFCRPRVAMLARADLLHPGPRHAQHPGDAELFLGAPVEVDGRHFVEPNDDLERLGLAAVLGEALLELGDVAGGFVPGVGPADPAVAVPSGPLDGGVDRKS